jgi:hypothetical protein
LKLGLAYPGPFRREADAVLDHCVQGGMSWLRAYAVACLASIGEQCWQFQSSVARFMLGKSTDPKQIRGRVRTIQRAVRQAKAMGVLVSRRLRRGERPPGARQPITCGGAVRRFIAWGKPKAQAMALRAKYALREVWRREALDRRQLRERSEIAAALTEFRALPT